MTVNRLKCCTIDEKNESEKYGFGFDGKDGGASVSANDTCYRFVLVSWMTITKGKEDAAKISIGTSV